MAKINRIHVPYSREDNTLAQPSAIIGPDGNELRQVKDEEGNVIWGKYNVLIEDDMGNACKFSDVLANPEDYTKWDSNFDNKLNSFEIIRAGTAGTSKNKVHGVALTSGRVLSTPKNQDETAWEDLNLYDTSTGLRVGLEVKEGFYINENKTAASWGDPTLTLKQLIPINSCTDDYVFDSDLTNTQYGCIFPKYGQFKLNSTTASGTVTVASGYPKRVSSLTTKHPNIPNYSYSGSNIVKNAKLSNADPIYFGDQIAVKTTCSDSKMYPENSKEYTFTLDGTAAEGETQAEYLDVPVGKTSSQIARQVPLDIKVNYPLYFEGSPYWNGERSAITSGSHATLGPIIGYSLKDANLIVNPFCLSPTGALDKPIKLTLHCDKGRFMAGSYDTNKIYSFMPFMMRPSSTVGGGTGYTGVKIDSSGSLLTTSFTLNVANNSILKKSALEHPWKEYAKSRIVQVNRPLFYYTNVANTKKSANASKPSICYITYSYNNILYKVDYMLSTPSIAPVDVTVTRQSSYAEGDGYYSAAHGGFILERAPEYTIFAPLTQKADSISAVVKTLYYNSSDDYRGATTSSSFSLSNDTNLDSFPVITIFNSGAFIAEVPSNIANNIDTDWTVTYEVTLTVVIEGVSYTKTFSFDATHH